MYLSITHNNRYSALALGELSLRYCTSLLPTPTYLNRFSTAFQLTTSQIALKYSALRFWYCRLKPVSESIEECYRWHSLVSMLPSIDAEQRRELSHNRILVLRRRLSVTLCPRIRWQTCRICLDANTSRLVVLYQPCPAASLDACQCLVELRFEVIQAAKGRLDDFLELAARWFSSTLSFRS